MPGGPLQPPVPHLCLSFRNECPFYREIFFPELSNSCLNWIFCQKREKRPTYLSPSPTSPFPVNVLTLPLRRTSWKSYTQPLLHR